MPGRRRWTLEDVEAALRPFVAALGRMPSMGELRAEGQNALAVKLTRTRGGIAGWAKHLGVAQKNSETQRGQAIEANTAAWLESLGYAIQRQTTKAPFDLLVNLAARVDVKSAKFGVYKNSHSGGSCAGYVF